MVPDKLVLVESERASDRARGREGGRKVNLPLYVPFCKHDFLGKVQKVFKKAFLSFW